MQHWLWKHEEFMSRFVLCSLLNGPFGLLEHDRAVIGYFQGTLHVDNGISSPSDNS